VFTGSGLSTLLTARSATANAALPRLIAADETNSKTLDKSARQITALFFIVIFFRDGYLLGRDVQPWIFVLID